MVWYVKVGSLFNYVFNKMSGIMSEIMSGKKNDGLSIFSEYAFKGYSINCKMSMVFRCFRNRII